MMNRRERYLAALRGRQTDALVWAPNFDWWYSVNAASGTIPAEYAGLSGNDLIRAVGGTIWRRVGIMRTITDGVTVRHDDQDGRRVTVTTTPVGTLQTLHVRAPERSGAWFLTEHAVKTVEDLRPLKYIVEATHYEPDFTAANAALREVGDDGIVLTCLPCVPYIEFAKMDVGYANAFYLLADHPEACAEVIDARFRKFLEAYAIAATGPLELVSNGDNMDGLTCPPAYFEKYAIPFYREVRRLLHAGGKIAQGHWCGRMEAILPLVPDCGLDVVEAIVPKPMTRLDFDHALDVCAGKVVIQGGIPAVFMCEAGATRAQLADYIRGLLDRAGHRPGFILGMGDNVPADADFTRVRMVSDLVADYNANVRPGRVQP